MRTATVLILLAATGCASTPPKDIWVQQRAGLLAMPDPAGRASALAQVTQSAAYDGDAAAVEMLLADLANDPRHDDLAARCAEHLKPKSLPDAERVAGLIQDRARRREVLDALTRKPSDAPAAEGVSVGASAAGGAP